MQSFFEHPQEIYLGRVYILGSNLVSFINRPNPRPFPGKFLTFSEYSQQNFSQSLFCYSWKFWREKEKKGQFCKSYFEIFKILKHPSFSDHFQKCICSGVFSLEVGCRLTLCNFLKQEFHYTHLFGYFPKFPLWLFQSNLRTLKYVLMKKLLHQRQPTIFLQIDLLMDLEVIVKKLNSRHMIIVFSFKKKPCHQLCSEN